MAPSAIETVTQPIDQLTGNERAAQVKKNATDRPLNRFTYGPHLISGAQVNPVKQIRIPTFSNPLDERAFRKLHAAACIRWLDLNGYNNEGVGGYVTVRDPIKTGRHGVWVNVESRKGLTTKEITSGSTLFAKVSSI